MVALSTALFLWIYRSGRDFFTKRLLNVHSCHWRLFIIGPNVTAQLSGAWKLMSLLAFAWVGRVEGSTGWGASWLN